jgi:ABC-2 type transport system permease protein
MKSKTSFCNTTIIKKDITRLAPLWAAELLVFVFCGIVPLLSQISYYLGGNYGGKPEDISKGIRESVISAGDLMGYPFLVVLFCLAVALWVFGYLTKERECYTIHSFPMKRTTLFFSHYLAGLLMLVIPEIFAGVAFWLIGLANGHNVFGVLFLFGLQAVVEIILFYHLACLVVMLTGNMLMSGLIYGVLNVLVCGVATMYASLAMNFVYGSRLEGNILSFFQGIWMKLLTPVFFFWQHTGRRTNASITMKTIEGDLGKDCIYLIPAVIFLALAVYLYKKRKLECAGDMVAFSWGKPVFRIVFTFCGAMLFTAAVYFLAFYENIAVYDYVANFRVMLLLVCVGAVLCYLIANMLLHGTFFIWKKTSYLRMALLALCLMAGLVAARKCNLGSMLPHKDNIMKAAIEYQEENWNGEDDGYNRFSFDEKEDISAIYKLNQKILAYGRQLSGLPSDNITYLQISYTLKNGKTWETVYPVEKNSSIVQTVKKRLSSITDLEAALFGKNYEETIPEYVFVTYWKGTTQQGAHGFDRDNVTEDVEADELYEAVLKDLSENRFDLSYTPRGAEETAIRIFFEDYEEDNYNTPRVNVNLFVTEQCTETMKILKKYSLDE